jgi:uncharacterized protein YhaN
MKHFITIFFLTSFLVACDKPNPTPEANDPIYNEMLKEAAETNSAVAAAQKELEDFQKNLDAVVPQTGQIKYAQKRVSETTAKIEKLKQMKQYWEIRADSRKDWDRKSYLQAYNAKKPWPDPEEYEQYKLQRKLQQAPRNWNLKERIDQARAGVSFEPSASGGKEGAHGEASHDGGEARAGDEKKTEGHGEH